MARGKFIAVVDFGSQYTHLITRALQELGVEARLVKPTTPMGVLSQAAGIVLSGSPASVVKNPVPFNHALLHTKLPVLGVCYGLQLIMQKQGGRVEPGNSREYGSARLNILKPHPLLTGFPKTSTVWMSHGDSVTQLAPRFTTLASTSSLKFAAVTHRTKPIFGVQFHPEVHHTTYGSQLYKNFAYAICGLTPGTVRGRLEKITADVRAQVGSRKVFLLVSGGVDSTVAFAVLNRVLGPTRVYGLHVDTGLMRHGEASQVKQALKKAGFNNLHVVRAGPTFFRALKGITEPEHKRQIIGETFLVVKATAERKLKLDTKHWLLGQGTIYPDTIESGGTKHADKIKTHHNRIGVLTKLAAQGKLVEPLRELYKDEVRELGAELRLPKELLWQHPFPGPGLGVRVLCLNKKTAARLNATNHTIPTKPYTSRVLPILSVGVQGDERSYRNPLAVEASYRKAARLHRLATNLLNRHRDINRVIIKLSGAELNLGSGRAAGLTEKRLGLARDIDRIVMSELKRARVYENMWQCPVVLIPFGNNGGESAVLRPFESREAMTGRAHLLPAPLVARIVRKLRGLNRLDYIFYDITDKPPGTVEWE